MENRPIYQQISLRPEKLIDPNALRQRIDSRTPVLLLLAAGKGTRFGTEPKCARPVCGTPLARRSIDAFRRTVPDAPVVGIVGYKSEEVARALGNDNVYVLSDNPTGGTAWAVYEAFCVPGLLERNPIVVISMGDRIVPAKVFDKLLKIHRGDFGSENLSASGNFSFETAIRRSSPNVAPTEADLTLLTARYEYPKNKGKGRIIRDSNQKIVRIIEERDIIRQFETRSSNDRGSRTAVDSDKIDSTLESANRLETTVDSAANDENAMIANALLSLTEGNCPLYAIRARTLLNRLMFLSNANAQNQFYLTDIVEQIAKDGGIIRSLTVRPNDSEYAILCADVTRPENLVELEAIVQSRLQAEKEVETAAATIRANRPQGQTASICRQLQELWTTTQAEGRKFDDEKPFAVGISGGRLRIAFMHPDMGRFFGPAWQTPIGAKDENGSEQIVVLVQETDDRRVHLFPLNPEFRESIDSIESDAETMYPDESVRDWYSYEEFGAKMSESLLLSLGYFSDQELETRRRNGIPTPPESLWVANNMRRPFSLVGNVIASLRTVREGTAGERIRRKLGKNHFLGLRMTSSGSIPQGGFSSSSAVTIATKNALNVLFDFGLTDDQLIRLACQAEYGTGVRAGSLDQATIQKGKAGLGTLLSSNPKDDYAVLGVYPIPSRIQVFFPFSADRDREAFRWSGGFYSGVVRSDSPAVPTTTEIRKMTGKSAEIAAILLETPLDVDLFQEIQDDLLKNGVLNSENRRKVADRLLRLPLWISKAELERRVASKSSFYSNELKRCFGCSDDEAARKTKTTFDSLFQGWREPIFRRPDFEPVVGVPLRSMIAYLYAEVAKNFYLTTRPESWIESITRSQRGDCCFEIDYRALPSKTELLRELPWEIGFEKEKRLDLWLKTFDAKPFDFCRGLDDESLADSEKIEFHRLDGTNFFRGSALIDLAEAMLKRAFGDDAVAVRVNAAGQGDYFQVHLDAEKVDSEEARDFLRQAFYRRFQIVRETEFIETCPGGGAAAVRLSRFALLPDLIAALRESIEK